MRMRNLFVRVVAVILILAIGVPIQALAQANQDDGLSQTAQSSFRPEELDQMLAPIALYPDSLLAQMLMAATYPLEVIEASRFVTANKNLQGDQLLDAAKVKDWDPSVKSLLQFSDVLAMMDQQLEWTTDLGNAFLGQQRDVMDSIQRLRAKAQEAGNLTTTNEQVVKVVEKQTIVIEPANPQVVYVPAYNPEVVYGTWWYPAYPPYVYYPPAYVVAAPIFLFATGVIVGAALWGAWDWRYHRCYVNINNYNYFTRRTYKDYRRYGYNQNLKNPNWQHRPEHRKAVPYRDNLTAQRYGQARPATMDRTRDYRGFEKPGGRPDPTKFQKELAARSPTAQRPRPDTPGGPAKGPQPKPPTMDKPRSDTAKAPVVRPATPPVAERQRSDTAKAPVVRPATPPVAERPLPDARRGAAVKSEAPAFTGMGSGGSEQAASLRGQSSRDSTGGSSAGLQGTSSGPSRGDGGGFSGGSRGGGGSGSGGGGGRR